MPLLRDPLHPARTTPAEHVGLACRLRGFEGMRLTKLAPEVRYNLSDALSRAPKDA